MATNPGAGSPAIDQLLTEANGFLAAGRMMEAERACRRVLSMQADHPDASQLIGVITYRKGDRAGGRSILEDVLKRHPGHAGALINYGVMAHFEGEHERAIDAFQRAIEADPGSGRAHASLGSVMGALGRFRESEAALRRAVELDSNVAETHFNLGNALQGQGRHPEALKALDRALELRPDYFEAWINVGNAHFVLGDVLRAEQAYKRAIAINPRAGLPYSNLATLLYHTGNLETSEALYRKAVEVEPGLFDGWLGLGNVLRELPKAEEALAAYDRALAIKTGNPTAIVKRAVLQADMGCWDEALEFVRPLAAEKDAPSEVRLMEALLLPLILPDIEEIGRTRRRVREVVSRLREEGIRLENPARQVGITNFYLAYHRENEIELQKEIAALYLEACPELGRVAPHCAAEAKKQPSSRIRLGLVSSYLRGHTIGKLFVPMLRKLDAEKFETVFFAVPGTFDQLSESLAEACARTVHLSTDFFTSQGQIAEQECDVLFYPEIGMDPQTYYLAFSRLAPVQAMTWGHPVTTGIPNMDYFVSSEALELPNSDREYTERLVRLPDLTTYYEPPEEPPKVPGREEWGFSEDDHLYVCPQTLFKIHPDFDLALAEILKRDPKGRIVFIAGRYPTWETKLRARFERTMPGMKERVHFLPQMPLPAFLNLNRIADALIDPFYFVGGNSSAEAFSVGAPIVTWPGELLRARITYAWYSKMEFFDLVADGPESFVELSVRLAADRDWREHVRSVVAERSPGIYRNEAAVRQLEDFFIRAHKAASSGGAGE